MADPMHVLILSDGRPGHFNLSEGIVVAAGRLRPIVVSRLDVRRGRWPGAVLAGWTNSGVAPERLLKTVYGIDGTAIPPARLVVSAGAETIAANVAIKRVLGAANVFYGSLRQFQARHFDLALTSYAEDCREPNQAFALKPSAAAIAAWAQRVHSTAGADVRPCVLVGGPSGESHYTETDWQRLLALVESLGQLGLPPLVANSRRTPDAVSDHLAGMAAAGSTTIASFVDVRRPDAPTLLSVLTSATVAFVTDDSSSMVSEAIVSGLPVIGLCPVDHRLTSREARYRATLIANGWYEPRPLTTPAPLLLAATAARTPPKEDPAEPIVRLLADHLPQLFGVAS